MILFNNELGRLGNQLFTYASIISICKRKNINNYVFSTLGGLKYFVLTPRVHFIHRFKIDFILRIVYRLAFLKRERYMSHTVFYNDSDLNLVGTKFVSAALQSEDYFAENTAEIRTRFKIKDEFQTEVKNIYSNFNDGLINICIHVRRSDYLTFQNKDYSVPKEYYTKVLSQFSQENHRFIFISDDIGYVKEHFGSFKNVYYSSQNEITDFQLMMYADICVTANSTFSWWGAWLNEKPTKKIYVPKYFMGISDKTEFPSQIIPKNWIQVDVSI